MLWVFRVNFICIRLCISGPVNIWSSTVFQRMLGDLCMNLVCRRLLWYDPRIGEHSLRINVLIFNAIAKDNVWTLESIVKSIFLGYKVGTLLNILLLALYGFSIISHFIHIIVWTNFFVEFWSFIYYISLSGRFFWGLFSHFNFWHVCIDTPFWRLLVICFLN